MPLYQTVDCDVASLVQLHTDTTPTFDLFCVSCGTESVFRFQAHAISTHTNFALNSHNEPAKLRLISPHTLVQNLHCSRNTTHVAAQVLYYEAGKVAKIGEYPSRRDRASAELRHYRKNASDADYQDLNAAIGLSAHGIGAGAFVYLRRIFERRLSEAAKHRLEDEPEWEIDSWRLRRMEDKIDALADRLPNSVIKHRIVYSILSKGVHELSEDECKMHFGPLRSCIEAILDDEIEMRRKQEKEREIETQLAAVRQVLSSK